MDASRYLSMGWRVACVGVVLSLLSSTSRAQSREPGVWVEGLFGASLTRGSYESEGFETSMSGGALDVAGAFGHMLDENWALGLVPNLTLGPVSGGIDDSSASIGYTASVSAVAAYRPPGSAFLLRPSLGLERAAFAGSNDDVGGVGPGRTTREWDFPPVHGPVVGATLSFGGIDDPFGFWIRASFARLRADRAAYDVVGVGFGLLLERWGSAR